MLLKKSILAETPNWVKDLNVSTKGNSKPSEQPAGTNKRFEVPTLVKLILSKITQTLDQDVYSGVCALLCITTIQVLCCLHPPPANSLS